MASLGCNLSEATVKVSYSHRSHRVEGVKKKSEGQTSSLQPREVAAFGSYQQLVSIEFSHVNVLKTPHVNSRIISFFDFKEIATIIKHINKQLNHASKDAIRLQLIEKKSLSLKEIVDYQHLLGLEDPAEVLRLCVLPNGESTITHLDVSHSKINDDLLHRLVAELPNLTSLNLE